jgi:hypothetical protein
MVFSHTMQTGFTVKLRNRDGMESWMNKRKFVLFLLVSGVLLGTNSTFAQNPMDFILETDKQLYGHGEPVEILLEIRNRTSAEHCEVFACPCWGCVYWLTIIDESGFEIARYVEFGDCMMVIDLKCWRSGAVVGNQVHNWPQIEGEFPNPGTGLQVPPGTYRVQVLWRGQPGETIVSEPFHISAQPAQVPTLNGLCMVLMVLLIATLGAYAFKLKS